ncbi:hypothetical protein FG877_02200 [Enterococcus casseliflavus]|nr:hypothetical protein [Enterococcus casseliflavus]
MEHNIKSIYLLEQNRNEEGETPQEVKYTYKDLIKSKNGNYSIHKERFTFKEMAKGEEYLKYEALQFSLNCLYHDAVIDKKVKRVDSVYIYTDIKYLNILNEAIKGKKAYAYLKDVSTTEERKYLMNLIKAIQKIYNKAKVSIVFKGMSKEFDSAFSNTEWFVRQKVDTSILDSVKNRTEEEAVALKQRFKVAFEKKDLVYEDFI